MRRFQAAKVNEETKAEVAPGGIRVIATSELINKLTTSDEKLSNEEVELIGGFVVSNAGFNHKEQFAVSKKLIKKTLII